VNSPLSLEQDELGELSLRRLARATERWVCSSAARTLVVSTPLMEILVSLGVAPERLLVMPNGVDAERFHGQATGSAVRALYRLEGKRVLGFVGWLRSWHGLAELVTSMAGWSGELADVELLVVGDGPARAEIERAAREAGVSARVHITGAVRHDAIVDHIAAMDVALQPAATPYASPMKVFEYLAMGKPVVAPRQANLTEILTEGRNARFFDPGDPKSLAEAVRTLVSDRDALTRMGAEARATIFRRGYLWCENARRTVDLVDQLRRFGAGSRAGGAAGAPRPEMPSEGE
jgi:glycosyltransferase involved in cell wall biosynthesis